MRTLYIQAFAILMLFITMAGPLHAKQDTLNEGGYYMITTQDDREVIGQIKEKRDASILIDTEDMGEVSITTDRILHIREIEAERIISGKYWYSNPMHTRYFFAPNAMGLKQGTGYYQNTWVFLNNANYGFTDYFSMGGGMIPLFLVGERSLVWMQPKFTYTVMPGQLHLTAGGLFGGIPGFHQDTEFGGLAYAGATFGNENDNITLSVGRGVVGESFGTLVNLSGMLRITRSSYLVSENYGLITEGSFSNNSIIFLGYRWAPENFALDLGLFRPLVLAGDDLIGLPWLGVSIPFGDR